MMCNNFYTPLASSYALLLCVGNLTSVTEFKFCFKKEAQYYKLGKTDFIFPNYGTIFVGTRKK